MDDDGSNSPSQDEICEKVNEFYIIQYGNPLEVGERLFVMVDTVMQIVFKLQGETNFSLKW